MSFQEPLESYNGKINEATLGSGDKAVAYGGEAALPFHSFEGDMPKKILIAFEVYDVKPENWPAHIVKPYADVLGDPVAWAKKCQDEFKADSICLQLTGADPGGANKSADELGEVVKKVAEAINVPLIVYGCGNVEKDSEVLKKVAEVVQGQNVLLGPTVEDNYKTITAAAMGFNHCVAGLSPIDVNMAKQLNILMTQLGLDTSKLVIDPTAGALGYGLEYCYSVIERLKTAALQQNDAMTQMPIISNLAKEVWRAKEVKVTEEEEPKWGDAKKRGILWEALTALSFLIAGSDLLVMRHPEAVNLVRKTIDLFQSD